MLLQTAINIAASKDKIAQIKAQALMKPVGSLIFYHTALEVGLLQAMTAPSTADDIAGRLKIADVQMLSSLLDLGCALGELSHKGGKYRIRGAMSRALLTNQPVADIIRETVRYHADIALRLGGCLLNNGKIEYPHELGGIIASSSRLGEPMIKSFIQHTVKKSRPLSILEFGCGSGEYLKYYADINPDNRGIAIDLNPHAVAIAGASVKKNGIEKNFTVLQCDIMDPSPLKGETFDLVTSFSNIYYFTGDDRKRLFASVRNLLKDGGRFMLATMFRSGKMLSAYYDMIFASTECLYRLPVIDDIVREIKEAGFGKVKVVNILDESFRGIVAGK